MFNSRTRCIEQQIRLLTRQIIYRNRQSSGYIPTSLDGLDWLMFRQWRGCRCHVTSLRERFYKLLPPYNSSTRNKHIESGILVCYSNRSLFEGEHLGKIFTSWSLGKIPFSDGFDLPFEASCHVRPEHMRRPPYLLVVDFSRQTIPSFLYSMDPKASYFHFYFLLAMSLLISVILT